MDFDAAYASWLHHHYRARYGEGAKRIQDGLEYASRLFVEKVWWPVFHSFDDLHPEYQIRDFKDGYRYIDFAYIQPHFQIAIEIDGFGPHWKDITPEQFTDHCVRQNHLMIDEWQVLRFAFATVQLQPRICQQTIQQLIARLLGELAQNVYRLTPFHREIVRLAMRQNRVITTNDVMNGLGISRPTARRHMKRLAELQWLEPTNNPMRVHGYRLHPSREHVRL